MSRSSHQQGFAQFPFLSAPSINSFTIPRSYNHSSDESEADAPSGGGGGAPYDAARLIQANYRQHQDLEDAPFIPPRDINQSHSGATRGLVLPPQDINYEYNYSEAQLETFNQQSGYYREHTAFYSTPSSMLQPSGSNQGQHPHIISPPPVQQNTFEAPFPDAGEYLRHQLGIPGDKPVNLWALPDPPPGQRPSQSLPILIKLAIYGSPQGKLSLKEIYETLEKRFSWFRENSHDKSWKGSIRHNLSLKQVFRNIPRPISEPGKGRFWVLDVSKGEGYKRERKRRITRPSPNVGDSNNELREDEDKEEDELTDEDRSSSGSPGPDYSYSTTAFPPIHSLRIKTQSRSSSPYPQFPLSGYSSGQPNMGGYNRIDAPPMQSSANQATPSHRQAAFGHPSMNASGSRTMSQPTYMQLPPRPTSSRASTVPIPHGSSMSSNMMYDPRLAGRQQPNPPYPPVRPSRRFPGEHGGPGFSGPGVDQSGGTVDPQYIGGGRFVPQYGHDLHGEENTGQAPGSKGKGKHREY